LEVMSAGPASSPSRAPAYTTRVTITEEALGPHGFLRLSPDQVAALLPGVA
jgi:hypothetical protein